MKSSLHKINFEDLKSYAQFKCGICVKIVTCIVYIWINWVWLRKEVGSITRIDLVSELKIEYTLQINQVGVCKGN